MESLNGLFSAGFSRTFRLGFSLSIHALKECSPQGSKYDRQAAKPPRSAKQRRTFISVSLNRNAVGGKRGQNGLNPFRVKKDSKDAKRLRREEEKD
jgi:hypothetical protein